MIAACFVVCATMGVRQTFGLYSSEFENVGGTSNTEFGLAIAVHAIFWGFHTYIWKNRQIRRIRSNSSRTNFLFYFNVADGK